MLRRRSNNESFKSFWWYVRRNACAKSAGIEVDTYYASELDKFAVAESQANFPDIIQLGDVTKWREWDIPWGEIDLLLGGSPCQGFSSSGKGLNFQDPRSKLFFEYVDILEHIKSLILMLSSSWKR